MYVGPEVSYNIHKPELASLRFRVFTGRSFETYPRNPRTRSGSLEKKTYQNGVHINAYDEPSRVCMHRCDTPINKRQRSM